MNKEEIFNIFYGKEKWDVWNQFLKIESSIESDNQLYDCFDDIKNMLINEKAYIKMRGFRIICKLSKWDKECKINSIIDILLDVIDNEKPTIVRMCFQNINDLLLYKPELSSKIKNKLENLNLLKYKDSMQSLIKKDIDIILKNV